MKSFLDELVPKFPPSSSVLWKTFVLELGTVLSPVDLSRKISSQKNN